MSDFEVGLHARATRSLVITSVLALLFIPTLPIALYALFRIARMRVKITATGFEERGLLMTDRVNFDDVARFGNYTIASMSNGGDAPTKMRVDGSEIEIWLVFQLKSGKTVRFLANQYERHFGMIERLAEGVRVPREDVQPQLFGYKWS